jgi:hypothetical protein
LLDKVEELVLGGSVHHDVQLFQVGKLGLGCSVIKVAIDMFKVDGDWELCLLQHTNGTD